MTLVIAPPMDNWRAFRLTQRFGENPADYAPYGLAGHEGLDWAMPEGTPILACHTGRVTIPAWSSTYGMYLWVTGEQVATLYAHLSQFEVAPGTWVEAGQTIALSGNTGRSTGPHLHLSVYPVPRDYANGYKGAIDPMPLLLAWEEAQRMDALTQAQVNRYHVEEVVRKFQQADQLEAQASALRFEAHRTLKYLAEHNGPLYHLEALLGGPVPAGYRDGQGAGDGK